MTLNEFVKKYDGCRVDYDGYYGPQCMDLYRQYCRDVLCVPRTEGVEGAKDLFEKYEMFVIEKRVFEKQKKGKAGDVVVWGASKTNRYGHVAILLCDYGDSLIVFEQDGFKQDGARIRLRSKENLLGYLRKKEK
jgi:hypothetical protein